MRMKPYAPGEFPTNRIHLGVNLAGLAVGLAIWFLVITRVSWPSQLLFVFTLAALFLPIVLFEAWWLGWHRWQVSARCKQFNWKERIKRLGLKWIGLAATLQLIVFGYAFIPEFTRELYDSFHANIDTFYIWLLVLSVPYLLVADAIFPDDDAYLAIGRFFLGRKTPGGMALLKNHARDWLVKAFFMPFMLVLLQSKITFFSQHSWPGLASPGRVIDYGYELLYLIDIWFGAIGYLATSRLLQSHIRSSDNTISGWLVAVLCYPPFFMLTSQILAYDADQLQWQDWLPQDSSIFWCWGAAILMLLLIYSVSTVALGYRASNLTYRGITTDGFYRFSKHPAYISKNLSWWLISIPFIAHRPGLAIASCALLGGMNVIYYLRARTEERHLSRYPEYVEYALEINRRSPLRHIPWLRYKPPSAAHELPQ